MFQALHARPNAFVIPNPWDAGTARILAALGFEALATTSAGLAFALGQRDGTVSRDETLANASAILAETDLPVSADLENGFGDAPGEVAETIRLAAAAGLVGGSIEDASGDAALPIYGFDHAAERIAAAVEAARALPFPFMLTARAENFLHGTRTSTIPSGDCRPLSGQGRMCSMRRACRAWTRSAPCAPPSRAR